MTTSSSDTLKTQVRKKYGQMAETDTSCCGASSGDCTNVSASYADVEGYAADADLGLGCGIPTEFARIQSGEHVIDLGAGAGLDAFVARRTVGEEGFVLGVDMTEAMIEKARRNVEQLGYENVEFRLGEIEDLPVEDDAFDLALSNCVLNLVPDKARAFREIYRVLRPGGRFCISDIVSTDALPDAIREDAELYVGCVAGALSMTDYLDVIRAAGFTEVEVATERPIELPDKVLRPHLSEDELAAFRASDTGIRSVTVLGTKPSAH